MYALADCNNFFASCERVFRPELNGRPVIVLSNNDGCAVARSNEARALGVKMGDPYFKLKPLIDAINRTLGPGSILFGIQGDGRFHMTQEHKSPHYTTRWTELPKVSVK